jgi:hypothetical protein
MLTLFTTLFTEAGRQWRAGQTPDEIQAAVSVSVETVLDMLEHGIGH